MSLLWSSSSSPGASSSRWRSAVARAAALPSSERRLVLAAAVLLPLAIVVVRLFALGRVLDVLRRRASRPPRSVHIQPIRAGLLVHAVAERLPFHSSCLERSVVVAWLLCRGGHRCALVIETPVAVRPFQAHAWVDTADGPIGNSHGPAAEIARWAMPEPAAS